MITEKIARSIMGDNFIGKKELEKFLDAIGVKLPLEEQLIPYDEELLNKVKDTHVLIFGAKVTIRQMRDIFGCNPDVYQPCFYNQDWYLAQKFMDEALLDLQWFIIPINVDNSSRAVAPQDLINKNFKFPSAIQCTYAFFAYYFAKGKKLWEYDFVWCSDLDHNGDRIYVGKYTDIDGVNKSGFSIHRHLALRPCYGAIEVL